MALNCHPLGEEEKNLDSRRRSANIFPVSSAMMDAAPIFSSLNVISGLNNRPSTTRRFIANHRTHHILNPHPSLNTNTASSTRATSASDGIAAIASDPAQVEITWQIVIGAIAGVAPFWWLGLNSARELYVIWLMEQRKCKVCRGSGLVLRYNKYYFRCPGCGGFLPWQSWRRFFTG